MLIPAYNFHNLMPVSPQTLFDFAATITTIAEVDPCIPALILVAAAVIFSQVRKRRV